ncbi:hypothetical protein BpHYR1_050920, partial [Brachionus plicatilis]
NELQNQSDLNDRFAKLQFSFDTLKNQYEVLKNENSTRTNSASPIQKDHFAQVPSMDFQFSKPQQNFISSQERVAHIFNSFQPSSTFSLDSLTKDQINHLKILFESEKQSMNLCTNLCSICR